MVKDDLEEIRCQRCDMILCRVLPTPGLKLENLCRKCGSKDYRSWEGVPPDVVSRIRDMVLDEIRKDRDIIQPTA